MVNQVNKVASFIGAHVFFHDQLSPLMIVGTCVAMGGTAWYSAERLMERKRAAAPAPAKADEETPLKKEQAEKDSSCIVS